MRWFSRTVKAGPVRTPQAAVGRSRQGGPAGVQRPGLGREHGQVQRDERVLQAGEGAPALAVPDRGAHQFGGRAGDREAGFVRHGGAGRVAAPGMGVPGLVEPGEVVLGGFDPVHRTAAGRRHVDVEGAGEGRLGGQEAEEGGDAGAQHLLRAGVARQFPGRGHHPVDQQLATHPGGGEEAVLFVGEVLVEGTLGHPGAAHDVGHRGVVEAVLGHRGDGRPQQPLALRRPHGLGRQPVTPAWQTGFALVRAGKISLLFPASHTPNIQTHKSTRKFLCAGVSADLLTANTGRPSPGPRAQVRRALRGRMQATSADTVPGPPRGASVLWRRQLDGYPNTGARITFLAVTVLATITLYYELYVAGSVSTLLLANLHMSFTFYVVLLAFGNLIGAFGSLFAGLSDRWGRANLVVVGLFLTGIFTLVIIPSATSKWPFAIESFVVFVVEGFCLVATPALIRDFSPQVGRATAMGFWTSGPVLGSLVVAVVGSATILAIVRHNNFWAHEYRISGVVGIVVFVIALIALRELSPQLRDQLMVTVRDRALIEARAKGIDVEAALRHPFRQLLKADIIISAIAVSLMLLIHYTPVGFAVLYLNSVFGFSVKNANGLGNWNWGFNVIAVVLIGIIADRFHVRKPFMVIGGVLAAVMTVVYLEQAGHHPGYYTLAIMLALLSFGLGVAYTPWMASFTETVEARNPALTATGLAIRGWVVRVTVFVSFLIIPAVVNSVTPLVNYGTTVSAYATQYKSELAFAQAHPAVVATAQQYKTQLANAQKFAPELKVIETHPALFTKLATYPNPATVPPALAKQAVAAAGGGATGAAVLSTISANQAAINGVIAAAPKLATVAPYAAQLTALSKVPPQAIAYLNAHAAAVQKAAAQTASQWRTWYWICFGGIIFFLLSIPLLKGRWRPSGARRDEQEHEAMIAAELAKLSS